MDLINPRLGAIRKGVTSVKTNLKGYSKISDHDPYISVMRPFLETAEESLKMLECNFTRMEKIYQEFIVTWNETPQTLNLQQVFTTIYTFVSDLKVSWKKILSSEFLYCFA